MLVDQRAQVRDEGPRPGRGRRRPPGGGCRSRGRRGSRRRGGRRPRAGRRASRDEQHGEVDARHACVPDRLGRRRARRARPGSARICIMSPSPTPPKWRAWPAMPTVSRRPALARQAASSAICRLAWSQAENVVRDDGHRAGAFAEVRPHEIAHLVGTGLLLVAHGCGDQAADEHARGRGPGVEVGRVRWRSQRVGHRTGRDGSGPGTPKRAPAPTADGPGLRAAMTRDRERGADLRRHRAQRGDAPRGAARHRRSVPPHGAPGAADRAHRTPGADRIVVGRSRTPSCSTRASSASST